MNIDEQYLIECPLIQKRLTFYCIHRTNADRLVANQFKLNKTDYQINDLHYNVTLDKAAN